MPGQAPITSSLSKTQILLAHFCQQNQIHMQNTCFAHRKVKPYPSRPGQSCFLSTGAAQLNFPQVMVFSKKKKTKNHSGLL